MKNTEEKSIGFFSALGVVVFLMVAIYIQIFVLKSTGTTQITLILVTSVAAVVAMVHGYSWKDIQSGILYGCNLAMLPMLILMLVGVLIASWIASGTIPALIYYGMLLLTPKYFLFSACLICCFGSMSTGSAWTTAATFGVGLMGVGMGLGIPPAITAGAIISGAIFGDKMSPLSDSTNLAAGVVQVDLFEHVKSMVYSTGPAIILSLGIYFVIGLSSANDNIVQSTALESMLTAIKNNYSLNLLVFLPPLIVVVLAMKKISGLAVMTIAIVVATILAITVQGSSLSELLEWMNYGYASNVGMPEIDKLLSGGGLQNMMWTVSLGFVALAMGGLFEKVRILEVLLDKMKRVVSSVSGLVMTHIVSSILANLFTASQYLAIIIPGRMLIPVYREKKLLPQVCSRVCEDSATVTSPLIPWGLGGVYYASVLGVSTMEYLPYTFIAFLAPMMTLILAISDKFMFVEKEYENKSEQLESETR